MPKLYLKVITPKKIVHKEEVDSVTIPSAEGELTILPHHAHLFTLLTEGIIKIKKESKEEYLAIGGGYLETDGKSLTVLVSRAYGQDEIDEKLTQQAIESAKKFLSETKDTSQRREAMSLLRRSLIDLKLVKRRKRKII